MAFVPMLEDAVAQGQKGLLAAVAVGFGRSGTDIVRPFVKAIGKQAWTSEHDVSLDTTFWAYSCTKLLTTIAALQAVERGLIALDIDVSEVLPELKGIQVISAGAKDGSFELAPAKKVITLRQLLSHTSGLNYDAMNPLTLAWRKSRGEQPLVFSGRVKESYTTPLLFEPGEGWVYGSGIDWAGILVSRLNGDISLGDYMDENIFRVLGLKSSTFDIKKRPDLESRLMEMNTREIDGSLKPTPSPYNNAAPEHSGGMGLVTSVGDFTAVLEDLLKHTPSLLKVETVQSMFEPQFAVGSAQYKGFLAQEALHSQQTGDKSGKAPISFGLGGLVTVGNVINMPKNTLTWNGMPNISWYINRELGTGGLFVTQILPPGDLVVTNLYATLTDGAWKSYELHVGKAF